MFNVRGQTAHKGIATDFQLAQSWSQHAAHVGGKEFAHKTIVGEVQRFDGVFQGGVPFGGNGAVEMIVGNVQHPQLIGHAQNLFHATLELIAGQTQHLQIRQEIFVHFWFLLFLLFDCATMPGAPTFVFVLFVLFFRVKCYVLYDRHVLR